MRFFKFYIKIVSGGAKWHKVERCGTGFGDTEIRDKLSPFNHGTKDKEAAKMLVGKYDQNIDAKGRVSIPAKFRAALGENFVVTAGEEKCALLYPVEEWNKFMERIASDFEPQVRAMMMRYVQRNSAECSLDSQGRVVIPPQVREYAALSKEIVVVGEQTKVEIWSTDNWNEYADDNFDEAEIKKLLMQIGM